MARPGLLVVVERCIGCEGCVVGCKNWHVIPAGEAGRIRLVDETSGTFPDITRHIFPVMCMQCDYPPCVAVCRFQACAVDENGIVRLDEKRCVGCGLCAVACPYGLRVMRRSGWPDACDLCLDRLRVGKTPYCVASCPTQALVFGDLSDPESEISRLVKALNARPLKREYKTRPRVYYTRADEVESTHTFSSKE